MKTMFRLLTACSILFILIAGCKEDPPEVTLPNAAISDVTRMEGDADNDFSFRVALVGENTQGVTLDYHTTGETAVAGQDYTESSGTITLAAGETEKSFNITVLGDTKNEPDETFLVTLTNASGAKLFDDEAVGTIRNDDEGKLSFPDTGYVSATSYPGKTLVWQDEFDGPGVDLTSWTFETGAGGWGNNELQYYRPENTKIIDGNLVIEAKKESFSGSSYTSSRMITAGKKEFKYGRIDIRAVLPEGQGIWPALWMLGANIFTEGWPKCGEIDIMELVGHIPNQVHGTVHYGNNTASHLFTGGSKVLSGGKKFSQEYHVFSILWEENQIKWLVDDVQFFQIGSNAVNPWPFNENFFFIFNIAVGGNWPGSPDNTTVFSQYLIVDYIRVFQ
ncbi:MAG: family 16 glycosylhydrolase [Bacteroidia bacterium]|nr:family 16 glycosylhydrolase [Bacteroidia bacterium]